MNARTTPAASLRSAPLPSRYSTSVRHSLYTHPTLKLQLNSSSLFKLFDHDQVVHLLRGCHHGVSVAVPGLFLTSELGKLLKLIHEIIAIQYLLRVLRENTFCFGSEDRQADRTQ